MIGKEILENKDISVSDARNILEKRKKEGELSYEQKLAHDYSGEFATLKVTSARALLDDLMKIEGIDSTAAVQIADTLPVDKDDLMTIFEKRRKGLSEADVKKILSLVKKAQE